MKLDKKTSEEKAHATYSASGSARWLNCPGSIKLCESAPESPDSEYALEGTKAHACLEFLLKNRAKLQAAKKVALKTYPLEMVEYALDAVDWITTEAGYDEILCETRVDATPFTCAGQFGTLDAAIVRDFDRLTVIDYKYGAGIAVDPEFEGDCNPQLAYYALGISHEFSHNFTEVELVIIQPRAYHESGETTRSAVFTMDQLLAWDTKFREGVERTKKDDAPYCAGSWCKFCPAAFMCPELKENAMREAQIVFADDTIESLPETRLMNLPDMGRLLDAAEKLEGFIKAARERALYILNQGGEIPGWKLVDKRAIRKWRDENYAGIMAHGKTWADDAFETKLRSPAQLEKRICTKGIWSRETNGFIEEHVTCESSGTTLAPESDKRPAVKILSAFEPVE